MVRSCAHGGGVFASSELLVYFFLLPFVMARLKRSVRGKSWFHGRCISANSLHGGTQDLTRITCRHLSRVAKYEAATGLHQLEFLNPSPLLANPPESTRIGVCKVVKADFYDLNHQHRRVRWYESDLFTR
jgi:hypothetical protein